ncbi:DUF4843 domain-containing protein [Chitinophaga sp. sic0106]|uniref:DUF4843 domain-containing protein n=1 Tax=Chitinophaga sp. sic0106 TaxID=2854785 RepID=UPI001C4693D6|nr:DUF4843 domain-containing protein [Chitinophaga sp. sic0106]MBV7533258.1 DUF4843 domain-containing protein [Chitinophaga sp. sic0106]
MKIFTNLLYALALTVLTASCTKEGLKTFNSKADVYFYNFKGAVAAGPGVDSAMFTFAYAPETVNDSVINVGFKATGPVANVDRKINIRASITSTAIEGTHFEALPQNIILHAGKASDSFPIRLLRSPDLSSVPVELELELQANENFGTNIQYTITNSLSGARINYNKYRISISDILIQPVAWSAAYFGNFTRKKFNFICEVLELAPDVFTDNTMSIQQKQYYGIFIQRYLRELAANGSPVLEDDGTPMAMGTSVQ